MQTVPQQLEALKAKADIGNALLAKIASAYVEPDQVDHVSASVGRGQMPNRQRYNTSPRVSLQRAADNMVHVHVTWDQQDDGGITDHYHVDISGPILINQNVPAGTKFADFTLADDTATYIVTVTPLSVSGTTGMPGLASFVPHVEPPPPPPVPNPIQAVNVAVS